MILAPPVRGDDMSKMIAVGRRPATRRRWRAPGRDGAPDRTPLCTRTIDPPTTSGASSRSTQSRGPCQSRPVIRRAPVSRPSSRARSAAADDEFSPCLTVQGRIIIGRRGPDCCPCIGLRPDCGHVVGHPGWQSIRLEPDGGRVRRDDEHVRDLDGVAAPARGRRIRRQRGWDRSRPPGPRSSSRVTASSEIQCAGRST